MEQLGSYLLDTKIGEGSFSNVILGRHKDTGEQVAIKMLRPCSTKPKEAKEEEKLMRMLNHPHIIQLYEAIECPATGSQCLVLEYAPNGELFNYIINKGQLDESEAKKLFAQLVSAVEHMHTRNVIHRDIKPENLLLDEDNNLKLSDFGLSTLCTPKSLLKKACGSPLYSAPEILRREPYDGRASDVWAMGVVLFAMVTGEIAWHGATLKDQIPYILKGQYYLPTYLSTECKNLINSMLTVSPSKRATISQIRNHPWLHKCSSMVDITMRSPEFTERMNKLMAQKRDPIAPNAQKRDQAVQTTEETPIPSKTKPSKQKRSSKQMIKKLVMRALICMHQNPIHIK